MLESLSVKNIALIESAEITFERGLNVLTGETGAGKSILLDSIGLLLGNRIDKTLLRAGETTCKVVGKFSLDSVTKELFKNYCDKYCLDFDDEILIARTYNLDGKSDIRINGEQVTLSMLKELCVFLVNSYGQNENQVIFDASNHLKILDDFALTHNLPEFIEYQSLYNELQDISQKLNNFGGSDEERLKQIDILSYQIDEIENVEISVEDYDDVISKRHKLLNAGKIISNTTLAQNHLDGDMLSNISRAKSSLEQAQLYDQNLGDYAERLESVKLELADILDSIKTYNNNYDFSETEQQKIEDRFSLYNKLMRKYGKDVVEILTNFENMKDELDRLKNADAEILKLNLQKQKVIAKMQVLGESISMYRKKKAIELCDLIVQNLKNLSMQNAKLKFDFKQNDKLYADGIDRVELLFSANLGEVEKPLAKIASGGEISRFMLALKAVIAKVDNMPTMIFDEIDTGISGATSEAVAKQMAIISKNHQVIVVTHSQQIAAMADTNFLIKKIEENQKTITLVKQLDEAEKLEEVARFMSGDSINEISIKSAQKLIDEQNEYKKMLENIDNKN